MPQFSEKNRKKNQAVFSLFSKFAITKEVTPAQLSFAWMINKNLDLVPIPGTTKLSRLEENINAVQIKLSQEDINEIEKIVRVENELI
ncbi:aldo/keto reductase [Pedobacter chinensis]|uniref:aldo/keto reductase n=1 Tax=Pedobacter chinensis TaxID=2282421 RepID=UPI0013144B48|nr:aldo/keto reductase [Pedobacter chinensis]